MTDHLQYPSTRVVKLTNEVRIQIPALSRPTLEELQKSCDGITAIREDTSMTEAFEFKLGVIGEGPDNEKWESYWIDGEAYHRILVPVQNRLAGFQHAEWLVEHQQEHFAFWMLVDRFYIDFPGLTVERYDGSLESPFLGRAPRDWMRGWHRNSGKRGFNPNIGRFGVSSK